MNSLSWMIYGADVVGSVNNALAAITVLSGLTTVASGFAWLVSDDFKNEDKALGASNLGKKAIAVFAIALIASVPFPSATTIYAIAASEGGERALSSETGAKALKALNAWLDRQLKDEEK